MVARVLLDGRDDDAARVALDPSPGPFAGSQLDALLAHIRATAQRGGVAAAHPVWLAPLPGSLWLGDLPAPVDDGAPLGLIDDPAGRAQPALSFDLARAGNLVIFGQPGAGKTTLVQTLLRGLFSRHPADALHAYLIDFGNRGLQCFEHAPQVGGVFYEEDDERLARLFRMLRAELQRRKALPPERAGSREPMLLLVIDNAPAFARMEQDDLLVALARDGAALGMYLILTANRPMDIRARLSGNIPSTITLQLADRSDYLSVVGRAVGLEPAVPGRALLRGPLREAQIALPDAGNSDIERAQALVRWCRALDAAWPGARAPRIEATPEHVALAALLSPASGPVIGLAHADLSPILFALADGPHTLITGGPQSGRTTLLQTIMLALADQHAPKALAFLLVDSEGMQHGAGPSLGQLRALPHVRAWIEDEAGLLGALEALAAQAAPAATVLAIDNIEALTRALSRAGRERLDTLLAGLPRGFPLHVVVAGQDRALDAMDGWLRRVRETCQSFVLGGLQSSVFPVRQSAAERNQPQRAGQGYWLRRRDPRPAQILVAAADPARQVDRILEAAWEVNGADK